MRFETRWLLLAAVSIFVLSSNAEAQLFRRNRTNYNNQNCNNCNQNNNNGSASFLAPGEILLSESVAKPAVALSASYASGEVVYANASRVANASPVVNTTPVVNSAPVSYAQPVSYQQPASYAQPASYTQPIVSNSNSSGGYRPMPAFTHSFGTQSHDIGYIGPGDMRTHLWREHSSDLSIAGLNYDRVMSLGEAEAQSWHNYFHGTESTPPGGFRQ